MGGHPTMWRRENGKWVICDRRMAELVPREIRKNADGTYSAEVRVLLYVDDGRTLEAVRRIRFSKDEILDQTGHSK